LIKFITIAIFLVFLSCTQSDKSKTDLDLLKNDVDVNVSDVDMVKTPVETTDMDNTSSDGLCGAMKGQLFNANHPWNKQVDKWLVDSQSDAIINFLQTNHTASAKFRIDGTSDQVNNTYGITLLYANNSVEHKTFSKTDDFYTPDCDSIAPPIPVNGAIEGESAYSCENDGDCHLIVIDIDECKLFEMWRADIEGNNFNGGCLAVWNLSQTYDDTLRGDCCTSADAAGLPIAAHMFTADDIVEGSISHAIRFILPNKFMREDIYVRPATHSTPATSGGPDAPPYGARMRLKSSFKMNTLNPAAQIVAKALQKYGMILSDGGNITFTAANDRFTSAKWADVDLGSNDLTSLEWSDFEVVEMGKRFNWSACSCKRN